MTPRAASERPRVGYPGPQRASTRWGLAAVAAGLLVAGGIALIVLAGALTSDDDDGPAAPAVPAGPVAAALRDAPPAAAPFFALTETQIRFGDETLDVVLADDSDERHLGLRERDDIGPYDGMLFVFDAPTETAFTMSTVPVPLDIGFYDADGRVVDRLRMKPCPASESGCPTYVASGAFTYALETLAGDLPRGRISAAPA